MKTIKRWFKRNTHNPIQKVLAGFGRAMNRLYENRNHDVHSNGEIWLLKKLVPFQPKVIIDGGANIGEYAVELARKFNYATIHCFEPVPTTFEILANTTKIYSDKISLINKGLGREQGKLDINLFESNAHSSIYSHEGITPKASSTITIDIIRGDDYCREQNIEKIDLIKLDIEGSEMNALKGFENYLKENRVKIIQFEYGYLNILTKNLLIDYYDYLVPFGFQLGKLYPKKVEFKTYHYKLEDFIGPNYVAVHESEQEIISSLS